MTRSQISCGARGREFESRRPDRFGKGLGLVPGIFLRLNPNVIKLPKIIFESNRIVVKSYFGI